MFKDSDKLLKDSSPEELTELISYLPTMTQSQFGNLILDLNKKLKLEIWKKELEERRENIDFDKSNTESIIEAWNLIIDE